MKQSVLIVHNDYQLAGGEGNVAESEARLLSEHGHAVTMYRRDNTEIAAYGALQKLRLAFGTFFSFRTYREVRALIREKQIAIVHVHNTVPLISPSVYYAAWKENVPVVQTVHNYRFLCPNGVFYRDGHICEECLQSSLLCSVRHACYRHSRAQTIVLAGAIALHRALRTYHRVEAYIALTAFAKEKLATHIPKDRIYVRPNSVMPERAPIPYEIHDESYVFVGRLDREKGVWTLLHAFAGMPDQKLCIIGAGPEEAAMRAYIEEKGLTSITMLGQLPHADALKRVARARALVMPTQLYEGMPLTVLEAFALGTPVLGSALGSVQAMLQTYGGGFLFDPTDSNALIDCVQNCTQDALQKASVEALHASKTAFDTEANYLRLLQIYDFAAQRSEQA